MAIRFTSTPNVCRKMALYRFWAIILPTFAGLARVQGSKPSAQGLGVWGLITFRLR